MAEERQTHDVGKIESDSGGIFSKVDSTLPTGDGETTSITTVTGPFDSTDDAASSAAETVSNLVDAMFDD